MLVREIIKDNGKQVGIIVDNQYIKFNDAMILYKRGGLENVVLVNDNYFRSKSNYSVKITEVKDYVKRNENSLGQINKRRRPNTKGVKYTSSEARGSKQREETNRGGRRNARQTNKLRGRGERDIECIMHNNLLRLNVEEFSKVSPENFKKSFDNARLSNRNVNCVDSHSLDELKNMKCLMTDNGFVAVESNGNINSVLRDITKSRKPNFLRNLLINALINGGYKLDCFAIIKDGKGGLAELYCRYGFIPVVKDRFNKDFAPEGWNYERDGEPDVVFMYHCGDSIETIIKKSDSKSYKHYLDYDVPYITDLPQYIKPSDDYDWNTDKDDLSTYSQAMRYRDWVMEKARKFKN